MKGRSLFVAILCLVLTSAAPAQEVLTNSSIIELVKAGLSEGVIIETIQSEPSKFELGASGLLVLRAGNVNDRVISAMRAVQKQAPVAVGSAPVSINLIDAIPAEKLGKIPKGTEVRLMTDEMLASDRSKSNDAVRLVVTEDVKIGGLTVIAKGAVASGRIIRAEKKGGRGGNGYLEFKVKSVTGISGQLISLDAEWTGGGGKSTKGFGAFGAGKEVVLEKGSLITALVTE